MTGSRVVAWSGGRARFNISRKYSAMSFSDAVWGIPPTYRRRACLVCCIFIPAIDCIHASNNRTVDVNTYKSGKPINSCDMSYHPRVSPTTSNISGNHSECGRIHGSSCSPDWRQYNSIWGLHIAVRCLSFSLGHPLLGSLIRGV